MYKMRIGITTIFRGSAFSGAEPQVALYIARALLGLGHTVEFILPADSLDWFIDCKSLAASIPFIKLENGVKIHTYNLILEIGWFLPPTIRRQLGLRSVMFYHRPPVFYDIESSVYPLNLAPRNFENIDAIWTWGHFKQTDFDYLAFLSRRPVYTCPFIWDPVLLDTYIQSEGVPEWNSGGGPLKIAICESNESNTSQCTLPLTICSEINKQTGFVGWTVLNSEVLSTRPFFVNNVVKNLHLNTADGNGDISGNFIKRVRLPDLRREPNVIISHQRWRPLKYMLLDALYLGIPLIHNCELLRDISGAGYFYELNRIGQAVECWKRLSAEKLTLGAHKEVQARLIEKWGSSRFETRAALSSILEKSLQDVEKPKSGVGVGGVGLGGVGGVGGTLRLGFFDMWEDFQPQHNVFLANLLRAGIQVEANNINPNIIIFGPFGSAHADARFANVPKIFYTGENTGPRNAALVNVGFKRSGENYIRLPYWMLELNWFNQDIKLIRNPQPFPLNTALCGSGLVRNKFCVFVASNPNCVERNTLYNVVSRYKPIDSAGVLFNNVPQIPCGLGGAGGQHAKVEFYKQYKFALVCENSSDAGYVTEKLLHAKMGGCVPIYWGDPEVHLEFNDGGFINATGLGYDELLEQITKLDNDANAWAAMARVPLLSQEKLKEYAKIWDILARVMVGLVGKTGAPAGAASARSREQEVPSLPPYTAEKISDTSGRAIVTCCTRHTVDATKSLIRRMGPLYVWAWDISADEKLQLEAAGAKRVIMLDITWNPGWAGFWTNTHTGWKALCLVVADASFAQGTQILYMDYGYDEKDLAKVWDRLTLEQIYVGRIIGGMWGPQFSAAVGLTDLERAAPMFSTDIIGFTAGGKYASFFTSLLGVCVKPELITLNRAWDNLLNLMYIRNRIVGDVGKGFDIAYIINLDHRQDRLEKFKNSHPYMDEICNREPAVYGNTLTLTPALVHLFRNNDFKWKKGVMGVALSHYNIWKRLRDGTYSSYLVFEDDAVLCQNFMNVWAEKARMLPLDTDIVFLGGVLPPNMKALPLVTEPVNAHFARVKKHSLFGGPERRYFHFCAYSYYITKAGAAKLCALIEEKGIFTSIDHMMVNHGDNLLNIYFTTPLIAGCFQDADPNYQNADFNNFNRVDKFDTEIWNNVESFKPEEIAAVGSSSSSPCETAVSNDENTMIYFAPSQSNTCMESEWLSEIFAKKFIWRESSEHVSGRVFIFYQHVVPVTVVEGWINRHMDCEIFLIHCSDEQCKADIGIYNHPGVKRVFRNYWRPEAVSKKVIHFPLGYMNGRGADCGGVVVPINGRTMTWSFAGALDRPGRAQIIDILRQEVPKCLVHTTPTWMSPLNLGEKTYIETLRDAKFVPCLNGFWNVESYRFYEALEHGAIPIVGLDENQSYMNILCGSTNVPLFGLKDWTGAGAVINSINSRPDVLEKIQKEMGQWWVGYKMYLKHAIAAALV